MLRPYEESYGKTLRLRSFVAKSALQDDSPLGFEAGPYRQKPVLLGRPDEMAKADPVAWLRAS